MCGIAGWLNFQGPTEVNIVQAMTDAISHRGPDAHAIWSDGSVCFGHRRLAIIDLNTCSDQPMSDSSGRYTIVYNGEIYNYLELRQDLEERGAVFRTRSDTEVLLEAYKFWGPDCLNRLLGMFAFAIWDKAEQSLFVARDPIGKKPFFYSTWNGAGFAFASEPEALLRHPKIDQSKNQSAMRKFLVLGYSTGADTLWNGIKRLLPGHAGIIKSGQIKIWQYRDLVKSYERKRNILERAAAEEFNQLLDDATRIRCRADVDYGLFLSGGLDSNSVLASMVRHIGAAKTRTYSIGFSDAAYDESMLAERSAKFFGTEHQTFFLEPDKVDIDAVLSKMGREPLADVSYIPLHVLSQKTSKQVKMVLTGDGGDELFAGYPSYVANRLRANIAPVLPQKIWQKIYQSVDTHLPVGMGRASLDFKLRQFLRGLTLDENRAHFSWRLTQTEQGWKNVFSDEFARDFSWDEVYAEFAPHFEAAKSLSPLDRAMYVDLKTWLVDSVMVKSDRATMANGLEARAPLLDIRMFEFAASLPDHLKLDWLGNKKKLMKVAAQERLPEFLLKQKKRGFSVPVSAWFGDSLKDYISTALSHQSLQPYFSPAGIEQMLNEHHAKKRNHGLALFHLAVFAQWAKKN